MPLMAGKKYTILSGYRCDLKKGEIDLYIIATFIPYFISLCLAIIMTYFVIKSILRQDKPDAIKCRSGLVRETGDKKET